MKMTKEAFREKISQHVSRVLCASKHNFTILVLLVRDFLETHESHKLHALSNLEDFLNDRSRELSEKEKEFVASELDFSFYIEVKGNTYVLLFDEAFALWKVESI